MIVVDIEATGTDIRKHSLVSVGALEFENPQRQFYRECRVFEGAEIDPEALKINGFTAQQVTDTAKPTLQQIITDFVAWCSECAEHTLGGHNTSFDRDFLQSSVDRYGLSWRFGYRSLDLHSCAWMHMKRRGLKPPISEGRSAMNTDAVFVYVGLPEEPKPHNGLTGAKMEAEAFSRIIFSKQLLPEFAAYPIPENF